MRYILKISYDGTNYCGFQKQVNKITIQGELERCLSQVLKDNISITASGRTDAGVSAIEQVCHFDCEQELDKHKTMKYLNVILPQDIQCLSIEKTTLSFHARKSAKKKTYEYLFYVGSAVPVYDKFATNIGYNIDISKMNSACKYFIGEKDFSAFCASNTSVVDKTRTIYNLEIKPIEENLYKLIITGNGFLYNMVRIIMGTLVSIGLGKISVLDVENIINSKDRAKSGKTMPSKGLFLKKVQY